MKITLKKFLHIIGFLLTIKAVILAMYLIWGIQIIISGIVLPQWVIIVGIVADVILAYLSFGYNKKKG